jgi:hypothetical protein
MISKNEFDKLLDDLKIFARLHKIVRDEDNTEKRKYASSIVEDMFTRFIKDLTEMKENKNV